MPKEEEILETLTKEPELQRTDEDTQESVRAEANKDADAGATQAFLEGLDDGDVPQNDNELLAFLRKNIPGIDNATDEQVLAAWSGESTEAVTDTTAEAEPSGYTPEGFRFYSTDGVALSELPVEVQKFFNESKIGYNALGREHQKSLAEVVRNASMGHLNQRRYDQQANDIRRLHDQLAQGQQNIADFEQQAETWDHAMRAAAAGNWEVFQDIVQRYTKNLDIPADPRVSEMETKLQELEYDKAGDAYIQNTIRPWLQELSQRHNIPAESHAEFEQYTLNRIQEQAQLYGAGWTQDRMEGYLLNELPMELTAGGYPEAAAEPNGTPVATTGSTQNIPSDLQQQLQSMSAQIETLTNTQAATTAASGPPGSGPSGGSAGGSSGSSDEIPDFKTQAEGFAWLQNRSV